MAACASCSVRPKFLSELHLLRVPTRRAESFYDTRAVISASELIHRALDPPAPAVEDVSVDHQGLPGARELSPGLEIAFLALGKIPLGQR